MARSRRNKRVFKRIVEAISWKTFLIVISILSVVIIACLGSNIYRTNQEKKELAQQREELDKQIEDIFSATVQNIADSNSKKRDSIITLSAVGDILCENELIKDAKQKNTYDFNHMFQNITGFLKRSDIVLGTMETNFVGNKYSGFGLRNSPKEFADAVKNSGVNLVSISTNHSLDYGINGLKKTKEYLQNAGYDTVGDSLGKNRVTIKTVKDTKLAFLSYTCVMENQKEKTKKELETANFYNEKIAKKDLNYAKKNADFIFVIMHWGDSYATKQNKDQEKIANFLIDNGANIILGNHSAAIQPMQVKQNKEKENVFIAYSLGNYICADNNDTSKVELALNIQLRKSADDGKITLDKVDYTPIYMLDNGEKAQNRYELIDMKGVAKRYANGEEANISKETYEKLLKGLKLLQSVIEK